MADEHSSGGMIYDSQIFSSVVVHNGGRSEPLPSLRYTVRDRWVAEYLSERYGTADAATRDFIRGILMDYENWQDERR